MKYKVGDRVDIRRDLHLGMNGLGSYGVTSEMCEAAMENDYIGTIVEVFSEVIPSYRLDIHEQPWWEDWMFVGLATDLKFCSKEILNFLEGI